MLRAEARAFAQLIACGIHPLNNHRVRVHLERAIGATNTQVQGWYEHWIAEGFAALEATLARRPVQWPYCFGEVPGWAELHLVPQLRNARRFDCDLSAYPRLTEVESCCVELEAFRRARPEQQPDYPTSKQSPLSPEGRATVFWVKLFARVWHREPWH